MSKTRIGQPRSFAEYQRRCHIDDTIGIDFRSRLRWSGRAERADKVTEKVTSEDKFCESSQSFAEDTFLASGSSVFLHSPLSRSHSV